jgi:hypothetical protein
MNIRDALLAKRRQKAQAKQAQVEKKRKNKMHYVPTIALISANVLVLSLDYRVFEAMYKLTDNIALAIFALFTTGIMFILWFDVLYQYLLANEIQKGIALGFSGLSLVSAGFFAFLDYGLSAGFGVDAVLPVEATLLFAGMVVLTVANGVGLFAWYIYDDQVMRKSIVERNRAENEFDAETIEDANLMLEKAGKVLEKKQVMEKRFGKDAVDEMMSMLAGIEDVLGVDLNGDGRVGTQPQRQFASDTKEVKPPENFTPPSTPQK